MLKSSIAAALSVIASHATALSCLPPDVATTFNRMNEIPESVYVVKGSISFADDALTGGFAGDGYSRASTIGWFSGSSLGKEGFSSAFEQEIDVQEICTGHWCGALTLDVPLIAFVKANGGRILLEVDPCGSTVFYNPTPKMESDLISCIRGETCESKER